MSDHPLIWKMAEAQYASLHDASGGLSLGWRELPERLREARYDAMHTALKEMLPFDTWMYDAVSDTDVHWREQTSDGVWKAIINRLLEVK